MVLLVFIRICWLERIPGRKLWFSALVETGVLVWGAGEKQEKVVGEFAEEGSEWGPHKFKSEQLADWVMGGSTGWEQIWLWMFFQKDMFVLRLTALRIRAGYSHQIHPQLLICSLKMSVTRTLHTVSLQACFVSPLICFCKHWGILCPVSQQFFLPALHSVPSAILILWTPIYKHTVIYMVFTVPLSHRTAL